MCKERRGWWSCNATIIEITETEWRETQISYQCNYKLYHYNIISISIQIPLRLEKKTKRKCDGDFITRDNLKKSHKENYLNSK